MDLSTATGSPIDSLAAPSALPESPDKVIEISPINGNPLNLAGNEPIAHLQSAEFTELTTVSSAQQLKVNEKIILEEKPVESPTDQPRKICRPFFNNSDPNYLKYKRAHDPCYKLANVSPLNPLEMTKSRFRAVLSQQKLKRIIAARMMGQQSHRNNVFHDLLPNETNIDIQMGSIAGYYGDMVVEDDLINFFGKLLPMYKPISHVVDSLTPSVSNKIKSTNFIWRNESSAGKPSLIDPCNDITFEYVSFKDQVATEITVDEKNAAIGSNGDLIALAGQGITCNEEQSEEPVQQEGEFMDTNHGEVEETKIITGQEELDKFNGETQHFTTNLLDANYYDNDFGMELKNAIDLIIN